MKRFILLLFFLFSIQKVPYFSLRTNLLRSDNPFSDLNPFLCEESSTQPRFLQDTTQIYHSITVPHIIFPAMNEPISGRVSLSWATATDTHMHQITYNVHIAPPTSSPVFPTSSWSTIATSLVEPSYTWNSSDHSDGYYQLIVIAKCSGGYISYASGFFWINNSPDVSLTNFLLRIGLFVIVLLLLFLLVKKKK